MHEYDMKTHIKIHSNLCLSTSPHSIIACPQAIIPVPNQNKFSQVRTNAKKKKTHLFNK